MKRVDMRAIQTPMTAHEVFTGLEPLVAPLIEETLGRRDFCVLAARIAIDVAAYFGVLAAPMPMKVMLYNAAFARHREKDFADVDTERPSEWGDDSWSVGIGCGKPPEVDRPCWDGHLIAVADGWFGDFSIQQAERPQHNIITGPAVVGPYTGHPMWLVRDPANGTCIEYVRIEDDRWRSAPDWRGNAALRRPLVGKLIRALREVEVCR